MGLIGTVGSPVEGEERFWDREAEVALMQDWLREGRHILLTAQRRMGKSSLMREVARRLGGEFLCLEVDLQSYQSPADVIAALAARTRDHDLWQKVKGAFGSAFLKFIDGVERVKLKDLELQLRASMSGDEWQRRGNALLEVLSDQPRRVVLFLDEVPILVNRLLKDENDTIRPEGRAQADLFLSWLRAAAPRHDGKILMVITGSIRLEPIVHRAGLSASINHLAPFDLLPWNRETALGAWTPWLYTTALRSRTGRARRCWSGWAFTCPIMCRPSSTGR